MRSDQSGSTLPEMAVAGLLLLTALAMAGGTVLAPLSALERVAPILAEQRQMDDALASAALVVRAARPALDGPAILGFESAGTSTALHLRVVGSDGGGVATLGLAGAELHLLATDAAEQFPTGILIDGLDVGLSSIEVLTSSGAPGGASALHDVAAVRVVLHRDGLVASRTVHLRTVRTLGTVRR